MLAENKLQFKGLPFTILLIIMATSLTFQSPRAAKTRINLSAASETESIDPSAVPL